MATGRYSEQGVRAVTIAERDQIASRVPKVTFGIIVLNGEPFTRYCLRALYPFAHEIIVVEGGHEDTRAVATPDGHSIDGTLDVLRRFCREEDPEGKVTLVTRDGFWPKTDELGHFRTPQSREYARRATGDVLWQVDIDEFYMPRDIERVVAALAADLGITAISFKERAFWGSPHIQVDGWPLRRGGDTYHRVFRWGDGYQYLTHEPPTVLDDLGRDLRQFGWVRPDDPRLEGVRLFHYSLLFPWQVEQKMRIYRDEKPQVCSGIMQWARDGYFTLRKPYRVHNLYQSPSWLMRYNGPHPPEVTRMFDDIRAGRVEATCRDCSDAFSLLSSPWYRGGVATLKAADRLDRAYRRARAETSAIRSRTRRSLQFSKWNGWPG